MGNGIYYYYLYNMTFCKQSNGNNCGPASVHMALAQRRNGTSPVSQATLASTSYLWTDYYGGTPQSLVPSTLNSILGVSWYVYTNVSSLQTQWLIDKIELNLNINYAPILLGEQVIDGIGRFMGHGNYYMCHYVPIYGLNNYDQWFGVSYKDPVSGLINPATGYLWFPNVPQNCSISPENMARLMIYGALIY